MRKQFFYTAGLSLLTVLFVQSSQAQNSSPYWSLAGNSNATSSSKLGTTNSVDLRLVANNVERMRIVASNGRVGIGTTAPINILTVHGSGGTPSSKWVTGGAPLFVGFGESTSGNADYILSMASNTSYARPVFIPRRARGTLASPAVVQNNDYLASFLASGYDGSNFQNPAAVDFYVDGTPSSGHVPGRISFVTGTAASDRKERLIIKANGNIGIGTSSPTTKLHVIGKILASSDSSGAAIYGIGSGDYFSTNYGVRGDGFTGVYGTGMIGMQGDGEIGILGNGDGAPGVEGQGLGDEDAVGVAGYASGTGSYGIYGYSTGGGYAGYFDGNVYTTGTYTSSDRALKQNVVDVSSAMNIINKLQPKSYTFRQDGNYKLMNLPAGTHYGLIAQDVEEVLPDLVKDSKFQTKMAAPHKPGAKRDSVAQTNETIAFKAINYTELIPIIVKAMQEQTNLISQQQQENNDLKARIAKLEELVSKLSGQSINAVTGIGTLGQATPNPASGTARISYSLPAGANHAQLVLTDNSGKTIRAISLNNSGSIDVNTTSLSGGVYNYSLLIDGNIVETKKMVVAR